MLSLLRIHSLKTYKITLKERGQQIKIYGNIKAKDALGAINQVSVFSQPYQEYVAKELKDESKALEEINNDN